MLKEMIKRRYIKWEKSEPDKRSDVLCLRSSKFDSSQLRKMRKHAINRTKKKG